MKSRIALLGAVALVSLFASKTAIAQVGAPFIHDPSTIMDLINEKKFTAEGAGQQLLEEAQALEENADLIRQIHEARTELSQMYLALKHQSQSCDQSAHTDSNEPQQHS